MKETEYSFLMRIKEKGFMMDRNLWNKAAAFHGHECPGLAIGVRAALVAMELLKTGSSEDEELVCDGERRLRRGRRAGADGLHLRKGKPHIPRHREAGLQLF
jgi:formylmethanofuran dehydrogenase subunit E